MSAEDLFISHRSRDRLGSYSSGRPSAELDSSEGEYGKPHPMEYYEDRRRSQSYAYDRNSNARIELPGLHINSSRSYGSGPGADVGVNPNSLRPATERSRGPSAALIERDLGPEFDSQPPSSSSVGELDIQSILERVKEPVNREQSAEGKWTEEEHEKFLHGMRQNPKLSWSQIARLVGTRTVKQVRTHAQKYFQKQERRRLRMERDQALLAQMEFRHERLASSWLGPQTTGSASLQTVPFTKPQQQQPHIQQTAAGADGSHFFQCRVKGCRRFAKKEGICLNHFNQR